MCEHNKSLSCSSHDADIVWMQHGHQRVCIIIVSMLACWSIPLESCLYGCWLLSVAILFCYRLNHFVLLLFRFLQCIIQRLRWISLLHQHMMIDANSSGQSEWQPTKQTSCFTKCFFFNTATVQCMKVRFDIWIFFLIINTVIFWKLYFTKALLSMTLCNASIHTLSNAYPLERRSGLKLRPADISWALCNTKL